MNRSIFIYSIVLDTFSLPVQGALAIQLQVEQARRTVVNSRLRSCFYVPTTTTSLRGILDSRVHDSCPNQARDTNDDV